MTRKKILIVADDHPVVREALTQLIAGLHSHITLYSADEPDELLKIAARRQQDGTGYTLVDIDVPTDSATASSGEDPPLMMVSTQQTGITARWFVPLPEASPAGEARASIEAALSQREAVQLLIADLASAARQEGRELPAAAPGGLPSMEALIALGLTPRQAEVLLFLAEGLSNKEIARKLDVSEWTVRHHVSAILERLEVSNRMRAANLARQLGQS